MSLKYLVVGLIISIFMLGCSASVETVKEDREIQEAVEEVNKDVDLEIIKSIGWVDLMPGKSPKFHISGRFDLLENENYELKKTDLKYVRISQSGKELYYILPKIIEETDSVKKSITYSTIQGLTVTPDLRINNPVDFELIFNYENEKLNYIINGVIVQEVQ